MTRASPSARPDGPRTVSDGDSESNLDTPQQTRRSRIVVGIAFATAGLLGAWWVWRVLRQTYFFQDEWALIRRTTLLTPLESATTPFNGHLWLFQDVIYRVQALRFGLDSNRFVVMVFIVALVTLQLTLSWFARRLGTPLCPALLFGGLLTYLGPAAQNYVFAVQISPTLATASAVGAAAIVIGPSRPGRRPPDSWATGRRATLVATLLLVSVLMDSGIGLLSMAFAGLLVLLLWPRRRWWVVVPTFLTMVLWLAYAGVVQEPATIGDRVAFAIELTARSAGALVGGGSRVGGAVLAAFFAAVVAHVRAGEMVGRDRAVTLAGAFAAATLGAAIAQSRSGIEVFSFYENNRYYQNVAIPLALFILPSLLGLVRRVGHLGGTARSTALSAVLVAAFLSGQNEARGYEELFVSRNHTVRNGVIDTQWLVSVGCPSGRPPDPDAELFGPLSTGLRTSLIMELSRRDLMTPAQPRVPGPALLAAICPP